VFCTHGCKVHGRLLRGLVKVLVVCVYIYIYISIQKLYRRFKLYIIKYKISYNKVVTIARNKNTLPIEVS